MNWYFEVLRKYAVFEGRAHRTEFWMYTLFNFVISIGLTILGAAAGVVWLQLLYGVAVFIPGIAVGARRLHDTNRSGWWQLIVVIPIVGWIVLIVMFAEEGHPGTNQHGPNPWGKGLSEEKTTDQRLRELDSLHNRQLISEEEYQEKRREILEKV